MIDLGRETDGNNGICLGVHFALCIFRDLVMIFQSLVTIIPRFFDFERP